MDKTSNIRKTLRSLRAAEELIPEIHETAVPIVVAYYVRQGRISMVDAMRITGLSESNIKNLAGVKTVKEWAPLARSIRKLRGDVHTVSMKEWVKTTVRMNPEYVLRILKAEREFGGTAVEKLPASKVFRLFWLDDKVKQELCSTGVLQHKKKNRVYTVDDLKKMKGLEYRELIRDLVV